MSGLRGAPPLIRVGRAAPTSSAAAKMLLALPRCAAASHTRPKEQEGVRGAMGFHLTWAAVVTCGRRPQVVRTEREEISNFDLVLFKTELLHLGACLRFAEVARFE